MTSITHNVDVADQLARRTIEERVQAAQEGARARAARRRARRPARPATHGLPPWTFRFLRTVH